MSMDSNAQTWSPDNAGARPSFRKPSNDAVNRKYRRHSPISRSSSSGGSPKNDRSPSPALSKEDLVGLPDDRPVRKNDRRELDKDSGRSLSGKGTDSHRYYERSYSSSHDRRRHDDYSRHHKHSDEGERSYKRSSQSHRESRANDSRRESEHGRSRDYMRNTDKYSRERHDYEGHRGKDKNRENDNLECQKHKDKDSFADKATSGGKDSNTDDKVKNSGWDARGRDRGEDREYKKDRMRSYEHKDPGRFSCEESTKHGKDSSGMGNSGGNLKEMHKFHSKDYAEQEYDVAEKMKYDESDCGRYKEREHRKSYVSSPNHREKELKDEHYEDGKTRVTMDSNSSAKKLKLAVSDNESGSVKDGSKSIQESVSKMASEPAQSSTNESDAVHDLNAAKVAAMKAAELVNRNLVAGGFMSADQKKKLLWGNKKNSAAEESSSNHWDVSLFSDRERQEKFYKLMSLRLPWYIWPIVGCKGRVQNRAETGHQRWRQPISSREAAGTSTRFREAVHCWAQAKRWTYSWSRSLNLESQSFLTCRTMLRNIWLPCTSLCKLYVSSYFVALYLYKVDNCVLLLKSYWVLPFKEKSTCLELPLSSVAAVQKLLLLSFGIQLLLDIDLIS